jgi:dTDP-4-amino-4,6-dideoxygalactose transaminase
MRVRRVLAPVGYRVSIREIFGAAALSVVRRNAVADAMTAVQGQFGVCRAVGVSSGKAALTVILRTLHRRTGRTKVIIPAYTCYSVPSAIVKAGLEVVPSDLAERSFDYDYDQLRGKLGKDVLCVLSIHLFGVPADTARLKELCRGSGIFVVEDAAQAMGGSVGDRPIGTLGDVSFFSLGRGKNLTCGSGGIVLTTEPEIAEALDAAVHELPRAPLGATAASFVTLVAVSALLSPRLYWLPSGLPFLKLGETIFHEDFPVHQMSRFQALLLRKWRRRLAALDTVRKANAAHFSKQLGNVPNAPDSVAYLRFPVVLAEPAWKQTLLRERDGESLGISPMYPTSVGAIRQLRGRLAEYDFPRADAVARSLVTLPTHPLVTARDRERICAAVKTVMDHSRGISATTRPAIAQMTSRL